MDAADGYVGDDGKVYRDPCTTRKGLRKERWPNLRAACYVVELVSLGMHRRRGHRSRLFPYHCPKCDGYHLAKCREPDHYRRHLEALRVARNET